MTVSSFLLFLALAAPTRVAAPPMAPVAKETSPAKPRPPRWFGHKSIVTIGGTTSFRLEQSYSTPNQFMFAIQPEVGYFLARHWLVGGAMQLRYVRALRTEQTTFGIGPIAAYQFNIVDGWDFLPTASLFFGFQNVHSEMGSAAAAYEGSFDLRAKFLWSVSAPLQVSIAPYFSHTLYSHAEQRGTYGVAVGFQGWL